MYYVGPVLGALSFVILGAPQWIDEGAILGLGAVLGDHVKSGIKRALRHPPGAPWLPDRFDFALGGGIMAWLYIDSVRWSHLVCLVAIAIPVHYAGNQLSFRLGLRKTPH